MNQPEVESVFIIDNEVLCLKKSERDGVPTRALMPRVEQAALHAVAFREGGVQVLEGVTRRYEEPLAPDVKYEARVRVSLRHAVGPLARDVQRDHVLQEERDDLSIEFRCSHPGAPSLLWRTASYLTSPAHRIPESGWLVTDDTARGGIGRRAQVRNPSQRRDPSASG